MQYSISARWVQVFSSPHQGYLEVVNGGRTGSRAVYKSSMGGCTGRHKALPLPYSTRHTAIRSVLCLVGAVPCACPCGLVNCPDLLMYIWSLATLIAFPVQRSQLDNRYDTLSPSSCVSPKSTSIHVYFINPSLSFVTVQQNMLLLYKDFSDECREK
jgi:hypothetical protein